MHTFCSFSIYLGISLSVFFNSFRIYFEVSCSILVDSFHNDFGMGIFGIFFTASLLTSA